MATIEKLTQPVVPELLTALKDLVKICEQHDKSISDVIGKPIGWKDTYLDKARSIIAKVQGAQ